MENKAASDAAEEMEVEFASRLTITDLGCDPKAVLKGMAENQTKVAIARMYGIVTRVGFQDDKNTGQQYTFFVGNFEGVNMQDGTVLQSSKLYLPEGASQALENIVSQVKERKGKAASVHFAFEIRLVKNANNRIGYSYETAAILKPEQADELAGVRSVVAAAPSPKPKPTEVPQPAKETAKEPARKSA